MSGQGERADARARAEALMQNTHISWRSTAEKLCEVLEDTETACLVASARANEAESRLAVATDALREALDFAEEGWSYASDYFHQKWDFERRMKDLRSRAALGVVTTTGEEKP